MNARLDLRRWPEIGAAFEALTELDTAERERRLAAMSGSNPQLHAELRALLAADAEVDERLAPLDAALPAPLADPFGLGGRTVSHFQVFELIGSGGMGVIYRAYDNRLNRTVALKFLQPSYTLDEVSKARFLREARSAATLDHPNVCTIYEVDSSADGWLFIAMPLYEGETLAARLARDSSLSVEATLQITRQIADGLRAAHARGIVHRDLKPGNIMLLPTGTVRILDFGLAKARHQSLTDTGAIMGTVSHMAPEQIHSGVIDARADLWALGVVMYEMLTGHAPFERVAPIAIAHAILHDEPVPPSTVNANVPAPLERLVLSLLQKEPDSRPSSAAAVLGILDGATVNGNPVQWLPSARLLRRVLPWVAAAMVGAAVVVGGVLWQRRVPQTLDDGLIAVVPFRVAGADPSIRYLREGMVDLLAAKLTGSSRVADPRATLVAWHAAGGNESSDIDRGAAIKVARKLGAPAVLLGDVTSNAAQVTLHATLVPVNGSGGQDVTVEGGQSDVLQLVDRLAVQLLTLRAGKDAVAPDILAATPLPAIREYLEAQRLARVGQLQEASRHFGAAVAVDSNFAAAWYGLIDMSWWGAGGPIPPDTTARQLVRLRDRLAPSMRAMVDSRLGLHYPAMPTLQERRGLAERAVQVARDNAYAWQYLGDVLLHWGAAAGVDNPGQRSIAAFEQAVALDSTYQTFSEHLPFLYYEHGDTAAMRRWTDVSLASDSSVGNAYLADVVLGDTKAAARWRTATRDDGDALLGLMILVEDLALPLRPVDSAMSAFVDRATIEGERDVATWRVVALAHARGQPQRAARLLNHIPELLQNDWPTHMLVFESVFGDVDSSLSVKARRALDSSVAKGCGPPFTCGAFAAAVYDLAQGNPATARTVLKGIRGARPATCWREAPSMCTGFAMVLDALLAARDARPDARARLVDLDSMLRDAPVPIGPLVEVGNLVAARLWEQSSDTVHALAALRRRVRFLGVPEFRATYLREEGRLAAASGDRDGAIRAYRKYLTLRDDPEPSLQPQVANVRRELSRLERETARR